MARNDHAVRRRFRASNDRLRVSATSYRFEARDRAPFVCECPDPACFESVMLPLEEYDRVRANPGWFVLAAGHEDPEAAGERIVAAEDGYAIVEEIGAAEATAHSVIRRE